MVIPLDYEPLESLDRQQLVDMVRRLRKALREEQLSREYNARALLQSIAVLTERIDGRRIDMRAFEKPNGRERAQETGLGIAGISMIAVLIGWPFASLVMAVAG